MSDKTENKKDPILSLNTNNIKSDLLLFKDETLKDIKEAQRKKYQINIKI